MKLVREKLGLLFLVAIVLLVAELGAVQIQRLSDSANRTPMEGSPSLLLEAGIAIWLTVSCFGKLLEATEESGWRFSGGAFLIWLLLKICLQKPTAELLSLSGLGATAVFSLMPIYDAANFLAGLVQVLVKAGIAQWRRAGHK